jgi:ABC-2 type transport system ATP-binding protein
MPTESTIVEVDHVTKRFILRKEKSLKERLINFGRSNLHKEDFFALRDVTVNIEAGTTVGLIGPNGSGKSTLLKTMGGIIKPSSGHVRRRGRMAALLELGAGFHPDLTGRENVFLNAAILGLSRAETENYFDDIVEFSGIPDFIDTQVKFYSSGMYVRLAFAVAVHVNPDILIVDEVLSVGDEPFQRKCLDRIRLFQEQGKTIILVSHALEQVTELCSRAIVMTHGQVIFDGDPAEGVRILREGFEAQRVSPTDAAGNAENKAVTLNSVRVRSSDAGKNTTQAPTVKTGESITVAIAVTSTETLDDCVVEIEVETPLGHTVFATNNALLDAWIPSFSGQQTVTFSLPRLSLGEGTYLVNVAVGSIATGELARASGAGHFSVRGNGRSTGTSMIDATMTLGSS